MRETRDIVCLGDVCHIIGGGTPSKKNDAYYSGSIPWATVRDMNAEVISETDFRITKEAVQASSTNIIPAGNVVIATRVGLGKVCLLSGDTAINQDLRGIIPKQPGSLLPRYLFYCFKTIAPHIISAGTGATVQGVKGNFVKSLRFPLPPLPEQKRIVAILDEAFAGIATAVANTEKNLANARELFEGYLNNVFTQKGEGWAEKKLEEVYDVRDGTHDSPKYHPEGRALITSKNLKRDGLNFEKIKFISEKDYQAICKRSGVDLGDVLFAMIGTIGNPIVVEVEPDFAIKNVALFKVGEEQNSHFLRYYLNTNYVTRKMGEEARGTTQKFVSLGYLRGFPILIPPLDEQIRIVDQLDRYAIETHRLESVYQHKLVNLADLKQSLLHKAFSGALTSQSVSVLQEAVA